MESCNKLDMQHHGTVSTLKKTFGFLRSPSFAREVFFHSDAYAGRFDKIKIGDVLRFSLESSQATGKLVAISMIPATEEDAHSGQCVAIADVTTYGVVQTPPSGHGRLCDGVLRHMDGTEVQHLTFSSEDVSKGSMPLAREDVVKFRISTDLVKQAAAEGSASKHRVHAAQKAVKVAILSQDEKVRHEVVCKLKEPCLAPLKHSGLLNIHNVARTLPALQRESIAAVRRGAVIACACLLCFVQKHKERDTHSLKLFHTLMYL